MRSRILTEYERDCIRKYLKADGKKDVEIRSLAKFAKKYLDQLQKDLALIVKFHQAYTKRNGK